MIGLGNPGRDDEKLAPDAPGKDIFISPAGMELTFQARTAERGVYEEQDPTTEGAVYEEQAVIEAAFEDRGHEPKRIPFKASPAENKGPRPYVSSSSASYQGEQPQQFREQFDHLMKRLEDRFQNERLSLEEKHCRELEEAMGYFSLSSNERELKQQELQASLLEDIGNMAQQLHELTGALASEDDAESVTLLGDPRAIEDYARKMESLEDQFQREKAELEQKQAREIEEALGTLKMSREQREAKQLELQDQISAEIGDMAKQLEELNQAKEAYESKMGKLKKQLSKQEPNRLRASDDLKLQSMNRRLSEVEQERDASQDELRRLRLALQLNQIDAVSFSGDRTQENFQRTRPQQRHRTGEDRLSPQDQKNISSIRRRIEQIESELREAAQTPGGSEAMKGLRESMKLIGNDLEAAEESSKEHFALEHLRARMEKVERLLTEGERAARDWEVLEQLRSKIGNVDYDLHAVEEAKKEFEALELLRSKMAAVESQLMVAEQLATDRATVENLQKRLGQMERDLGVAEPSREDPTAIDLLLARLAKAESSLQDARESAGTSGRPFTSSMSASSGLKGDGRDNEIKNILERLACAEKKLKEAKASAQRRHANTSSRYPNFTVQALRSRAPKAPLPTLFDESGGKIRAKLQNHSDETGTTAGNISGKVPQEKPPPTDPPRQYEVRLQPNPSYGRVDSSPRSTLEVPIRTDGGQTGYHMHQGQLSVGVIPGVVSVEDETIPTPQKFHSNDLEQNYQTEGRIHTRRSLRRRSVRSTGEEPGALRKQISEDEFVSATAPPLRRTYAWEAAETAIQQLRSTPYTVLGEDEDRYAADLEELRYQRALLSQKLPRNRLGEEEKKSDDSEPKYSFKQAIRNEEKRLREKMTPRTLPKQPMMVQQVAAEAKEIVHSTKEMTREPEHASRQNVDESQSKLGADPPAKPGQDATGDPPLHIPSLGKELNSRLLSPTVPYGRDPYPGNSRFRSSLDPPAPADPPSPTLPATLLTDLVEKEHPSDGESAQANPIKDRGRAEEEHKESPQWPPAKQQRPPPELRQSRVEPQPLLSPTPRPSQSPLPPPIPAYDSQLLSSPPSQQLPFQNDPEPAPSPTIKPPPPVVVQLSRKTASSPQQPIIHQTTVVDGKAATRERREKEKLMRWVVLILFCVAIILAVVIVVVIVLLRDPGPQNLMPAPTLPPSDSLSAPTYTPSSHNSTEVATMQPTLTGVGSWPPTLFNGCSELESNMPLTTDGITVDENTIGTRFNATNLGSCGTIEVAGDNGVWYTLIGKGEVVTVSTCSLFFPFFDTQLLIYTPSNHTMGSSCLEGLDCVASNDNFCGLQSSITFIAQADTLYFIYVNGMTNAPAEGMNSTEGRFSLTVSASPVGSCQGAFDLEVAPADLLPVIVVGSLLGGTFGINPCNPEVESRTGEIWYKVVGAGRVVVASTCHAVSNFEARLAVYMGFCDDLLCITSEDEDCGNGSQISWFAEWNVEYFLLVYSPEFVPDVTFGISAQEIL